METVNQVIKGLTVRVHQELKGRVITEKILPLVVAEVSEVIKGLEEGRTGEGIVTRVMKRLETAERNEQVEIYKKTKGLFGCLGGCGEVYKASKKEVLGGFTGYWCKECSEKARKERGEG